MVSTLKERLRAKLEQDAESGVLQVSRNGLINRAFYAQHLGVTPGALQFHKDVLAEYEGRYGIATGPLAKLPEVREWLETAYRKGELGLRDGKIDRSACMKRFAFKGGTILTRHVEFRELFESFDRRVVEDNYLPKERREELLRVKDWIASTPVLNKDKLTLNRHELARSVGVELGRLKDKAFADAIADAEARIQRRASASRIDPLFHDRVFEFSLLKGAWPQHFLQDVASRFKIAFSGSAPGTAKAPYLQLSHALEWIGSSANPVCRKVVADAMANGRVRGAADWEEAVYAYRQRLIDQIGGGEATHVGVDTNLKALIGVAITWDSGQQLSGGVVGGVTISF